MGLSLNLNNMLVIQFFCLSINDAWRRSMAASAQGRFSHGGGPCTSGEQLTHGGEEEYRQLHRQAAACKC